MPYHTPDSIPGDDTCRPLFIPNSEQWLALVSGAISELAKEWNWEQFGSVTPAEAAERMLEMLNEYYDSECGSGTCIRRRTNPVTLILEISYDDGETWETDESIPESPDRPLGESDPVCLAAANTAEVIALLYEDTIDAYNTNTAFDFVEAALNVAMGLRIASLFGAPVAAILAAGSAIFALAYQTLDILFTDYFTNDTKEKLICILKDFITMDGNRAIVDGAGLMQELRQQFFNGIGQLQIPQSLVWEQIVYLVSILGQDGLNHAAATTSIEEYDCDECGNWFYDMTPDSPFWYFSRLPYQRCNATWRQEASANGSVVEQDGFKWWQTGFVGTSAALQIAFNLPKPATTQIDKIEIQWVRRTGSTFNSIEKRVVLSNMSTCTPNDVTGIDNVQWYTAHQTPNFVTEPQLNFVFSMLDGSANRTFQVQRIRFSGTGQNPFI